MVGLNYRTPSINQVIEWLKKIPSTKNQITNKFQLSKFKIQNI
ncbi:hypothetical protein D1BOALGB6SA_4291 [Olavius sp. associated proteobacterium Delta 1]|nr:hypothetical protein D1BOALGB6SA_4291 [Olavius sp. associated proteobacterium Delta 1]